MNRLSFLAASVELPEGFLGRLGYGLKISVIGMLTVFFILVLLYAVLSLFGLIFGEKKKKKVEENAVPAPAPVAPVAPVASSDDDEDEIAAVIAAAVATYFESQNEKQSKYVIRSFKKIREDK